MDLKKCINNVHTNQSFPGRREDFPSQQAYENWQRREVKQLTELMNTMMLMKPNLALNAASETDVGFSNLLSSDGGRSRNSVQADPETVTTTTLFLCIYRSLLTWKGSKALLYLFQTILGRTSAY